MSKEEQKKRQEEQMRQALATASQSVGAYFTLRNRRFQVTRVSSFSDTVHYGFISVDEGEAIVGWCPVALVGQCEFTK